MPSDRAAQIALCLILLCVAVACLFAGTAKASFYRMVLCAANNGSGNFTTATNTASATNPDGIFVFQNACGGAPYPAGGAAFLRILESQSSGNAGVGAFGAMSWSAPPYVAILAGGGYTRQPESFNDGWRARFWGEGYEGSANNILMQGAGVANGSLGGIGWATTSTFASHLWPFGGYGNYKRFVFEMQCVRAAGCDRSGVNATDANTLTLTLNDVDPSHVNLTGPAGFLGGAWARGSQSVSWDVSDQGSGLRWERLRVDGAERMSLNWGPQCNLGANAAVGEFARDFRPCPTGQTSRTVPFDTTNLADGQHTLQVCSQDYGQAAGVDGTGGESCDQRSIRVDNNPPAAPAGLAISTANPNRYLDHFGAHWTVPPDPGSPVAKVHYEIVNAAGAVVVPEQVAPAGDPTKIDDIAGPKAPGDYRLRVWLEDTVGFTGPVATVAIPHDTAPPAAPQEVSVTAPETSRSAQGFDVRWRNITDNGAPIDAVHYQVLDDAGKIVVGDKVLSGANPQAIPDLDAPAGTGSYVLKLWLSDSEGNVGAPAEAPLSYDCPRSGVSGGQTLSAGAGDQLAPTVMLHQGAGSMLGGSLRGANGAVAGAPVCVFSRVVTDPGADFLGIAMTAPDGGYRFPIAAGPSREFITRYRDGHREIESRATALTRIEPSLSVRKKVVRNKHRAVFYGDIPGPHNDDVVVVLQVKDGKGWRAFRRYRTRDGGHYEVAYRFSHTDSETVYPMRAQVRRTVGLPYEPGNSREIKLRVRP